MGFCIRKRKWIHSVRRLLFLWRRWLSGWHDNWNMGSYDDVVNCSCNNYQLESRSHQSKRKIELRHRLSRISAINLFKLLVASNTRKDSIIPSIKCTIYVQLK